MVALKAPVKPVIENLVAASKPLSAKDLRKTHKNPITHFPEVYVLFFALECMRMK